MPGYVLLPLDQTIAKRSLLGCTISVIRSGRQIVAFRVFADRTGRGKFWSQSCHALADPPQPLRGPSAFVSLIKFRDDLTLQ